MRGFNPGTRVPFTATPGGWFPRQCGRGGRLLGSEHVTRGDVRLARQSADMATARLASASGPLGAVHQDQAQVGIRVA